VEDLDKELELEMEEVRSEAGFGGKRKSAVQSALAGAEVI
jgi:hypothetical protein